MGVFKCDASLLRRADDTLQLQLNSVHDVTVTESGTRDSGERYDETDQLYNFSFIHRPPPTQTGSSANTFTSSAGPPG